MSPPPIGLLGGTFDPVHYGHLRPAREVQHALGLGEVRLIPCHKPPHRAEPSAPPEARLAMLQCAVAAEPGFVVDRRELDRPGPSYMIDTLKTLRAELGATASLCLIVGHDAFAGLPGWHRWRALFEYAHLVVMARPGADASWSQALASQVEERRATRAAALTSTAAGRVWFQQVTPVDLSASQIRTRLRCGQSVRGLLPDAVVDYILDHGLYTDPS